MRSHNALEAVEHAKKEGVFDALNTRLYRAYWEEGREINRLDVLEELAQGIVSNPQHMVYRVEERAYAGEIVPFDDEAYAKGVFNVPTFFVGELKLAEQPLSVLRKEIKAWRDQQ